MAFANAVRFGRGIVAFRLGRIRRQFTVHEDLVCATSKTFRKKLQSKRRKVKGDCPICHEDIGNASNLTFCRLQCGQNFHTHCMDEWIRSQRGQAKCPTCRHDWNQNLYVPAELHRYVDLDEQALETYCKWLYTGQVEVDHGVSLDSEEFGIHILKALKVSFWVSDEAFKSALVAHYIAENRFEKGFWINSMNFAFGQACHLELRMFVIRNFLRVAKLDHYFKDISKFPDSFKEILSLVLLAKVVVRPTLEDILEEFTNGEYKLEE